MRIAFSLAFVGLLAACGDESKPAPPDPRYAAAVQIVHSCGGGFAGTYAGTRVHRNGTVERFVESASVESENKSDKITAGPVAVEKLFEDLRAAGFLTIEHGQPASYGCSFVLVGPDFAHGVYWQEGESQPPPSVAAALKAMQALKPVAPAGN